MNSRTSSIILLIILVAGAAILVGSQNRNGQELGDTIMITPSPQAEAINLTPQVSNLPTINSNINSWLSYSNNTTGIKFKYPPEVNVSNQDNNTLMITRAGPTQDQSNNFYDGINILIRNIADNGVDLEKFAQNRLNEVNSGNPTTISLRPITISNMQGFGFEGEGVNYFYLPGKEGRIIEIIDATVDRSNQGFAQIVQRILSSLTIDR